MQKFTSIFIFAFLIASRAGAADLSLQEAEDAGLANSPEIQIQRLQKESASWGQMKALSAHMPHLEIDGSHVFSHKYEELELEFGGSNIVMPAITPLTILSVQASINVFDGMSSWNLYQAAKLDYQAHDLQLSRESFRIRTDIRSRFYQALGAQALVEVSEQNIKTLEQHLNDINSQFRGGVSTKFDILRVEVQLEEARTDKMAADDSVVVMRAKLFEALGVTDEGRRLSGALPEKWDQIAVTDLKYSLEDRDDRKAQILAESIAGRRLSASHGYLLPQVSLFASRDWYNNMNADLSGDGARYKDAYQVGVSLRWNLFDGGSSLASEKQAALAQTESSQRLRALTEHIPVEFETWKRKLSLSIASYKARLSAIRKAEESVRLAKNGVRAGVRTNTEVLDAELDLNNTKAKAVKSQIDAVEALGQLELALGRSIARVTD